MRGTSIKTYHEIEADGTLTNMQRKVLEYIKIAGPITARSISREIPGAWKRISELEKMNCIREAFTDKDPVTKKSVTYWMYIKDIPSKVIPEPKISKSDPLKLHALYDEAFKRGVLAAIDTIYPNESYTLKTDIANAIIERVQK